MITPPKARHTLSELPRGILEYLQLAASRPLLNLAPRGDGHPVVVIPGYGGAEGSTRLLRNWLKQQNYDCRDWQQGRNLPRKSLNNFEQALRFRRDKAEQLLLLVQDIERTTGCQASLVGWSLGGLFAHDAASQAPELVRRVITLGTPFGDPRGTAVWPIMSRLAGNSGKPAGESVDDWAVVSSPKVATTIIHSHSDGFVHPSIARLDGELVEHVPVNSSHIGMTGNPQVYWQLAKSLAKPRAGAAPQFF